MRKKLRALAAERNAEYVVHEGTLNSLTTRIVANNRMENSLSSQTWYLLTVATGDKLGVSSFTDETDASKEFDRAYEEALASKPIPGFTGLPKLSTLRTHRLFHEQNPAEISWVAEAATRRVQKQGLCITGRCQMHTYDMKVYGSESTHPSTELSGRGNQFIMSVAVSDEKNTTEAIASRVRGCYGGLNIDAVVDEILERYANISRLPIRPFPAGKHDTIFESHAAAELLEATAQCILHNDVAYTAPEFGENITIINQPERSRALLFPFNELGELERNKTYYENGRNKALWNFPSWSAALGLPLGGACIITNGGPSHLRLVGGDGPSSLRTAAKNLGNGLIVRALHYLGYDDVGGESITGTTRFGTLIVEDGRVVARAPEMRMLDSLPRMLSNCAWLSKAEVSLPTRNSFGLAASPVYRVPKMMLVRDVEYTGATRRHRI